MEVRDLLPYSRLSVYIDINNVESIVEIGKENLETMIGLWRNMTADNSEEVIVILSDLASIADSKPIFPSYRSIDYITVHDLRYLKKHLGCKPTWSKLKDNFHLDVDAGTLLVGSNTSYGYNDPNILKVDDLDYLRKNKEYAEIWINSTKWNLNHTNRHALLYSFS